MKNLLFTPEAWEDWEYWLDESPENVRKIRELIRDCQRHPFTGLGKPEPLKHALSGHWSRRITLADRMVYRVEQDLLVIVMLRYHYK